MTKKKFTLSLEAIEVLRRVQRHILAEPRRYNQTVWATHTSTSPCGTAACLAGWTVLLGHRKRITQAFLDGLSFECGFTTQISGRLAVQDVQEEARRILGVPPAYRTDLLFTPDPTLEWPEPFASRWLEAKTLRSDPLAFAQIASDRIDYFIQTGV